MNGNETSRSEQAVDRRIRLDTAANMRDLGGLPVSGGTFAPRQVFRSATLARLNPADSGALSELGITSVFDLRTEEEREAAPDRLPDATRLVILDVLADAPSSVAATIGKLRTAPESMNEILSSGGVQQMLTESYRDFIRLPSATSAYRELFLSLAAEERSGAALFHCTAGKDRTGWAAASLLMLLGASEETVHADYLQTNDDWLPTLLPLIKSAQAKGVDPVLLRDALGVQPSYLAAALEQVQDRYGTIEEYFSTGLDLGTNTVDKLRERLVA